MLTDLITMVRKEWKELLLSRGGWRGGLIATVIIPLGILGVFMPWQSGRQWLSSPLLPVTWSWLPWLLVAALVADSFAGERERKTLETLLASRLSDRAILFGKIAALAGYGWGLTLGALVLGIITSNAVDPGPLWMWPSFNTVAVIVVLGLLTSLLAAAGGVLISLRASSVRQAAQINSLGLLFLMFSVILAAQLVPASWKVRIAMAFAPPNLVRTELLIAAVLLAVDVVLLAAAMARFQRARLILD